MRLIFLPFFITLALSLYLLNIVIYYPVVKSFELNKKQRNMLLVTLLLMTLIMVWSETIRRIWGINQLALIGNIWLGILSISFTVMVVNMAFMFVYRLLFKLIKKPLRDANYLYRITTTISLFLIVLFSAYALWNYYRPPVLRKIDIHSDKITPHLDGFKVVLLSEFHIMSTTSAGRLTNIINMVNDLEPDLAVITGDLIDEGIKRIWHLAPLFYNLESKYGTYVVIGNHDYYHRLSSFKEFVELAGLHPLYNENENVLEGLSLAGITDPTATRFGLEGPDVEKAFSGINKEDFIILLAHQPLYNDEALSAGADLIFAGHTHRGQIPPMTFLVSLRFKYHYGLYKFDCNRYAYTTSGVDVWGPPMRFGSNNEIVLFTLRKGNK